MLNEIKNNYLKNIKENKFRHFYLINAVISLIIYYLLKLLYNIEINYIITIEIIVFIFLYFYIDYIKTTNKAKKYSKLKDKLNNYFTTYKNDRINYLISLLKKNNIKKKADLKFIINQFNFDKEIKIKTDIIGIFITISVAILSFIEIAYNEITHKIDYQKIGMILTPTIKIIFLILIIYIIIYFFIFSKNKSNTLLIDDLTYIYFNYNHYRKDFYK